MTDSDEFVTTLEDLDVQNVFVYVGDAVRWDSLADRIAARGSVVRTVSASIHSPTSFASLATGRYPANHGVYAFQQRIRDGVVRLFDLHGYQTRFSNSIFEYAQKDHGKSVDPIYSVLREEPPNVDTSFEDLDSPFVAMERGPGGHAPYGDFSGTAVEYFSQHEAAGSTRFREDYRRSIQLDADLFLERLRQLETAGVADETLVIYTSDHGELLGEGGELGHNSPMRPELVYVPTVFIHPDMPTTTIEDSVMHHVDLLPTILDVLDSESMSRNEFDGESVVDNVLDEPRPSVYENNVLPDQLPFVSGSLRYEGVWDSTGGYVFVRTPLHERALVLAGKAATSAKRHYIRRNLRKVFGAYADGGTVAHEQPSFTRNDAEGILRSMNADGSGGETVDLSDAAEQRLQDLGYT